MEDIMKKFLFHIIIMLLISAGTIYSADPPVYVVLFMHNEDSALGNFDDPQTQQSYKRQRHGLVEFSRMLYSHGVPFCWQSDWKFLEGVIRYETSQLMDSTKGKNLVQYMSEDMGITVDPHSHENYGYNYADVAYLIDSLGVTPTKVIGGHVWDPYSTLYANWERFRQPLQGKHYPQAQWQGEILIGSATPGHTDDPLPSGIWHPKNKYNFWTDDPGGDLLCIGQYSGDMDGLMELIDLNESGQIDTTNILTCSFMTPQSMTPDFTTDYEKNTLQPLLNLQNQGKIKLISFTELVNIWKNRFKEKSHLYNTPEKSIPESFGVRVPSSAGGEPGIYVRISKPNAPRYGNDAPVVMHITGGWDGKGVSKTGFGYIEQGFIELQFNFPGSGIPNQQSGGIYDDRGKNCMQAAADVARFALGLACDTYGYRLHQMLSPIQPLYSNTGLCGWSNGGNAAITTAGAFGDTLPGLAWIVNWESPVGDGMPTVDAGTAGNLNPAYNDSTGTFDWTYLSYSGTITQEGNNSGGLYFDMDGDQEVDTGYDFIPKPYFYRDTLYYSEQIREAAFQQSLTLAPCFATVKACDSFWYWRNGEPWIDDAVNANPDIMFIVEAGDEDHVQGAPDHPHILYQYEGFRQAGARFVRLNPDQIYVEYIAGLSISNAADNDAFIPFDHLSIRNAVEPRGPGNVSMKIGAGAALCEVADRTRWNNLDVQLNDLLTTIDRRTETDHNFLPLQNYPNPFNSSTVIRFQLCRTSNIKLSIFNILGKKVRTWNQQRVDPGYQQIRWNGLDNSDIPVSSGIYFYRLIIDGQKICTKSMVLIR